MNEYDIHFHETTFRGSLTLDPTLAQYELQYLLYEAMRWRRDHGWTVSRVDRGVDGNWFRDYRWSLPTHMAVGFSGYEPDILDYQPRTWPR